MIAQRCIWLSLFTIMLGSMAPPPASAGVRVEEDEVIFTLRAPSANTVFLVGDFNNWNPTVDKMVKEGDVFEWSLFLVEGDYRYKFVVDGQWINDPDNPPDDPQRGSPLSLVEVPGGLMMKELDDRGRPLGAALHPSARYIGRFEFADDDLAAFQVVDVNVEVKDRTYLSTATFKTSDDSWQLSPLRSDISFDRGRFEATIWKGHATAFENDTIWASSDPFGLIGPQGVYLHNFALGKRGISLEIPLSGSLALNAVFADHSSGQLLAADGVWEDTPITAAHSSADDSTAYTYKPSQQGADTWGLEGRLRLGDYQAGFVQRMDRGFYPGLLNTMQRMDTLYENAAYRTNEQWRSMAVWVGGRINGSFETVLAYGHGQALLNRRWRSVTAEEVPAAHDIGQEAEAWDAQQKIQQSRRFFGQIEYHRPAFRCTYMLDYDVFEFTAGIFDAAQADVFRSSLDAAYQWDRWSGMMHVEYVDQDYGNAPPTFHIHSPDRNYWLHGDDNLLPETIVSLDEESYTLLRLTFYSRGGMFASPSGGERAQFSLHAQAGMTAGGMLQSLDYGYAQFSLERAVYKRFYLQLHSRGALYDPSAWGGAKTFLSGYVESGYRSDRAEISLGFGLDPVVLDPVRNQYDSIGRIEHLRGSLGGVFTRGSAADIGKRLLDLEHALETDRTVTLECILRF
ncbi:MAG: glycogen-binding domain-containing protein [Candidatus Latescibacterota bacterium]